MPDVKPEVKVHIASSVRLRCPLVTSKMIVYLKEIVLSLDQGSFYKETVYLNLGDLGAKIKEYVHTYQVKHKSSQSIESIADMKKFVEDYPEFRKLSGNVTKHVTLVGELSRLVAKQKLMESLRQMIERTDITADARIRLVLFYALRYEKSQTNVTQQLVDLLARNGVSEKKVAFWSISDLTLLQLDKERIQGVEGCRNVYTQHTPHLVETLQEAIKGRPKEQLYRFIEGGTRDKPQDIIVFMIGGATYAEAREVNKLNASGTGVRIVLGGTTVHNAQRPVTFISFVKVSRDLMMSNNTGFANFSHSMDIQPEAAGGIGGMGEELSRLENYGGQVAYRDFLNISPERERNGVPPEELRSVGNVCATMGRSDEPALDQSVETGIFEESTTCNQR
ncbi:vacuolar protein sorting-associated protein 45 [Borealophlyctis nickersoniae]|nr:vacuolar protein sorting-associated protein 45 [Borealophlyctis nickersoniae]